MITFEEFVSVIKPDFNNPALLLSPQTEFKQLEQWSSLTALIFINNIHDHFGVMLSSVDLAESRTLGEVFARLQRHLTA